MSFRDEDRITIGDNYFPWHLKIERLSIRYEYKVDTRKQDNIIDGVANIFFI